MENKNHVLTDFMCFQIEVVTQRFGITEQRLKDLNADLAQLMPTAAMSLDQVCARACACVVILSAICVCMLDVCARLRCVYLPEPQGVPRRFQIPVSECG